MLFLKQAILCKQILLLKVLVNLISTNPIWWGKRVLAPVPPRCWKPDLFPEPAPSRWALIPRGCLASGWAQRSRGQGASRYLAASFASAPRGKQGSITQPSPSPVLPQPPVFKPTRSDGCARLQGSVWRAPCPALPGPHPAHLQLTKHLTDMLHGFQFRTKLCTGIFIFLFFFIFRCNH